MVTTSIGASRSQIAWLVPSVMLGCAATLAWGFAVRRETYVTAEFGLGYGLGIVGTSMMVLLLGYSVRKRAAWLRGAGAPRRWLDVHMVLGLLGPTAILFHANFRLGSLNSNIALLCVLLVSSSGIVGRLLYPKIHRGLTGRRLELRDLRAAAEAERPGSAEGGELERLALGGGKGMFGAAWRMLALRRAVGGDRSSYPAALLRVAEFRLYERLFGLWHAFHLPLCILLFTAAAVHVVAVHMY